MHYVLYVLTYVHKAMQFVLKIVQGGIGMNNELIKQVMRATGELHITAKQLADECNLTEKTISRLFNGQLSMHENTRLKLTAWLNQKGEHDMDSATLEKLNATLDRLEKLNDNPWVKGKVAFSKWLGVSYATLDKMMKDGLPVHFVGDIDAYFFNKNEVNEYLLNK